jgi:hypothetical protein
MERNRRPGPPGADVTNPTAKLPLEDLVRSSGLIFTGTVVQRGTSTVPTLKPSENLVVVRVDRGLRVDSVLGDLRGKMITVAPRVPESLSVGQKAVFFTNSWIHGQGIAAREMEHVDVGEENSVAAAVSQLPMAYLRERLQSSSLVVEAEVVHIGSVERTTFERNVALWRTAELRIEKVLSGKPSKSTVVYFPTSDHPMWARAPRFKERQRGVFMLHAPSHGASPSEAALPTGSLVALDPADFQPESQLHEVEKLLSAIK